MSDVRRPDSDESAGSEPSFQVHPTSSAESASFDRRGAAVDAVLGFGSLVAVVVACRTLGVGLSVVLAILVIISPLVGEFAMTMAYRYKPSMTVREAFARLLWTSSCDACGVALSQWDILPIVPLVARRGLCGCGRFQVPRDCTAAGLVCLCLALAVVIGGHLAAFETSALVCALTLAMGFFPAMVSDVVHGECDEALLAVAAVPIVFVIPGGLVALPVQMLFGLAYGLLILGAALIGAAARGSIRPFPVGRVDLAVAFLCGLVLDLKAFVAASVWLLALAALTHVVVAIRSRRGDSASFYGPAGAADFDAAPFIPAVVLAVVLAVIWHPF